MNIKNKIKNDSAHATDNGLMSTQVEQRLINQAIPVLTVRTSDKTEKYTRFVFFLHFDWYDCFLLVSGCIVYGRHTNNFVQATRGQ